MNKKEALEILNIEMTRFRAMDYGELTDLIDSSLNYEKETPRGVLYQLEVQAYWDNPREPGGNIRLIASIDDGGFPYSFFPISSDFIKDPAGNFVGEID